MLMRSAAVALFLSSLAFAQGNPPGPEVDPKAVDAAVERGAQWLLKKYGDNQIAETKYVELVLLTLAHAGVRPDHPIFFRNFNPMLGRNLEETYNTGVRGLLLEKVNRKAYQPQLAEIAAFFVNSQLDNGQWGYKGSAWRPTPTAYAPVATGGKRKDPSHHTRTIDDGPAPGREVRIQLPGKLNSSQDRDNSNSQYAILGLFAASRAAVRVPKETLERAENWFESHQNEDGGWGYGSGASPRNTSTGSMTTAGLTVLVVAKFYQGKPWQGDPAVKKGIEWLGKNFSVTENFGDGAYFHYYYLYGLERVGLISGLEEFGGHRWYKEGADFLLKAQRGDGAWKAATPGEFDTVCNEVTDTCFAILFLRRATPALQDVSTEDKAHKLDDRKDAPPGK